MSANKNRIRDILTSLNEGLIEREEVMNLTFLSSISGESIFLLGPPGVAKSLIARRLKFAFKDANSFEYLMHRFSTPDEVFGPISVSKLKNEDKLERIVEYYLPGANVAFLDEIWKAGPSIQNTLLTILNEKIFRNGEQQFSVDLFAIIAASNELPEENQGLEALWDRFLLRYHLLGINEKENFNKMILDTKNVYDDNISLELKITKKEYEKWQNQRDKILIPSEILDLITHIRIKIEEFNQDLQKNDEPIYISDRRWKKIIKVLRTSAFLNNRKKVDLMDCFLIPHMIWNNPEQIDLVVRFVKECIHHHGYTIGIEINTINAAIESLELEVESETKYIKNKKVRIPKLYSNISYKTVGGSSLPFLSKDDFDSMKKNETSTNFRMSRNENMSNPRAFTAKKLSNISISINEFVYDLETDEEEITVKLTRKPHDALIEIWDKRIKHTKSEIDLEIKRINDYANIELKHLKENIFVNPIKADIVLNKIEELKVKLNQLKIQCDEIWNKYHSIEADE